MLPENPVAELAVALADWTEDWLLVVLKASKVLEVESRTGRSLEIGLLPENPVTELAVALAE